MLNKFRRFGKLATMETAMQSKALRFVALICALFAVVLGLLTFTGWISGLSILASMRAKYIPMAPSTALCFSLIGLGLVTQLMRPALRWLPCLLSVVVLAIACAKLGELLAGTNFGIDAWFVRNPGKFGAVPTGRMSPITAANFVFTAAGLLSLAQSRFHKLTGTFGALAAIVALVVLIGYCYGTPLLYGGTIVPVALSTACAFLLCGIAIVSAGGVEQWPLRMFYGDSTRALLLRTFVPLIVAAALINGYINTTLLRHWRVNPALVAALSAVAFAVLIGWIISQLSMVIGGRIDRAEEARNLAQAQLLALNAELEVRVQERTRELREKNQQMAEELRMARELQLALLPQQFPTVPTHVPDHESALRFLSLYFPTGDVSGDFFSVFPVGKEAAGVFICDVMGHGVRSALITSMIRALMEEEARITTDPGELLTRVNHALAEILKQARTTMFATCFYLVADVNHAQLRFANAGHPCALHIRQRSAPAEKLQGNSRGGPAMGIFPSASYQTATRSMAQGDLIMLFTDGLFEVEDRDGNVFTQEQLHATINRHAPLPPEEFFMRVLEDVRKFSKREMFDDDVCVVGVEVRHTNSSLPRSL
jgi:serine phosphatase RsbU (regulator of sigma subunit)